MYFVILESAGYQTYQIDFVQAPYSPGGESWRIGIEGRIRGMSIYVLKTTGDSYVTQFPILQEPPTEAVLPLHQNAMETFKEITFRINLRSTI